METMKQLADRQRMNPHNELVKKMLCDYLGGKTASCPVLLQGPWGCGKTYLIQTICEELRKEGVFVRYVSLNGVSSRTELDERLVDSFSLSLIHNVWVLKILRHGGALLSEFVQQYIPFTQEIGQCFKDLGTEKVKRGPLVFDDLERCTMPLQELLGYLENLVETLQVPTVYVCNEKRLQKKDETFLQVKEKFVGQTYTLKPDLEVILPTIIEQSTCLVKTDSTFRAFCTHLFMETCRQTNDYNYRAFQSALLQLSLWMDCLKDVLCENQELASHFACLFMAFSYPTQLGRLTDKGWAMESITHHLSDKTTEGADHLYTFMDALSVCFSFDSERFGSPITPKLLLGYAHWQEILHSTFDGLEDIRQTLVTLQYNEHPIWEPLMRFRHKSDVATRDAYAQTLWALRKHAFHNTTEIRFVFGLVENYELERFRAHQIRTQGFAEYPPKGWEKRRAFLSKWFRKYMKTLYETGRLEIELVDKPGFEGWAGWTMPGADRKGSLYLRQYNYVKALIEREESKRFKELLTQKNPSIEGFIQFLADDHICRRPIFHKKEMDYVRALIDLVAQSSVEELEALIKGLDDRYGFHVQNWKDVLPRFQSEAVFWERLLTQLNESKRGICTRRFKEPIWIITFNDLLNLLETNLVPRFKELIAPIYT